MFAKWMEEKQQQKKSDVDLTGVLFLDKIQLNKSNKNKILHN